MSENKSKDNSFHNSLNNLSIDHEQLILEEIEERKREAKRQVEINMENSKTKQNRMFNDAEAKIEKERLERQFLEAQNFAWETERQKFIRLELQRIDDNIQSISSSSSYVVDSELRLNILKEQYKELEKEYLSTPYKLGKETYKQVLVYENQNKDVRLESMDSGVTWNLYEIASNGYMNKSIKKVKSDNGKPTEILGTFSTDYIKAHFNGMSIPTTTELELLEPDTPFEQPKTQPRYKVNFGWQCFACKEMNFDDKSMKCEHCGAKRKY